MHFAAIFDCMCVCLCVFEVRKFLNFGNSKYGELFKNDVRLMGRYCVYLCIVVRKFLKFANNRYSGLYENDVMM